MVWRSLCKLTQQTSAPAPVACAAQMLLRMLPARRLFTPRQQAKILPEGQTHPRRQQGEHRLHQIRTLSKSRLHHRRQLLLGLQFPTR
jgi:hypothetical protein